MGRTDSVRGAVFFFFLTTVLLFLLVFFIKQSQAVTESQGQPYHGRLIDGVPFPNQFPGYQLRDESRTYTTPEVVGALLDGIEAVRTEFPDTCDVFLGDFSPASGGGSTHHRSHQNGRDVDVGMYAKDNRPLGGFTLMTEQNLDAPKTWCLLENIIRSQRVQYVFLDRSVQRVLYNYAVTKGYDQAYLDRVFGNVRGSLIQHVRGHQDHMHFRFFTPWSTLAAHIGDGEDQKRMVIEMAQQAYLPKKVNYYVNGSEKGLDALAQSFGVTKRDLCAWNHIGSNSVITPGSCLVFYKRSFEIEPVHLAQSLQPGFIAQAPVIQTASLRPTVSSLSDAQEPAPEPQVSEKRTGPSSSSTRAQSTVSVRKGDTLEKIAKRNHVTVDVLCQLNGMEKTAGLMPGQTIKVAAAKPAASSAKTGSARVSNISFGSDPKKPNEPTIAFYTASKGDTIQKVAKKSGIPVNSLCQMNGLKKNSALKPGQQIKLTQVTMPSKQAAAPTLSKTAAPAQTPAPSASVSKSKASAPAKSVKATKHATGAKEAKGAASRQPAASKSVKQQNGKPKAEARATDSKAQKHPAGSAKASPATSKSAAKVSNSKPSPQAQKKGQDGKAVVKAKAAVPIKTGAKQLPSKAANTKLAKK
jgi:LysM repeat protein/murein endopeptidase